MVAWTVVGSWAAAWLVMAVVAAAVSVEAEDDTERVQAVGGMERAERVARAAAAAAALVGASRAETGIQRRRRTC